MTARPATNWLSPSLAASPEAGAFETKFLLPAELAAAVEGWATTHLPADPHGRYTVTSVYLDTPDRAVLRRADEGGRKYRVRRYGSEAVAHLERKCKDEGRVWKWRTAVALDRVDDLDPLGWFATETCNLVPACVVRYDRTAFGVDGVRLTLDRQPHGGPTMSRRPELVGGTPLLAGGEAILELKYRQTLPTVFKELVETYRLASVGVSKYRRAGAALGLVPAASSGMQPV